MTSTRLSSWVATRSATVRPKKPEPTTTRAGLSTVMARQVTGRGAPPPSEPIGVPQPLLSYVVTMSSRLWSGWPRTGDAQLEFEGSVTTQLGIAGGALFH